MGSRFRHPRSCLDALRARLTRVTRARRDVWRRSSFGTPGKSFGPVMRKSCLSGKLSSLESVDDEPPLSLSLPPSFSLSSFILL